MTSWRKHSAIAMQRRLRKLLTPTTVTAMTVDHEVVLSSHARHALAGVESSHALRQGIAVLLFNCILAFKYFWSAGSMAL